MVCSATLVVDGCGNNQLRLSSLSFKQISLGLTLRQSGQITKEASLTHNSSQLQTKQVISSANPLLRARRVSWEVRTGRLSPGWISMLTCGCGCQVVRRRGGPRNCLCLDASLAGVDSTLLSMASIGDRRVAMGGGGAFKVDSWPREGAQDSAAEWAEDTLFGVARHACWRWQSVGVKLLQYSEPPSLMLWVLPLLEEYDSMLAIEDILVGSDASVIVGLSILSSGQLIDSKWCKFLRGGSFRCCSISKNMSKRPFSRETIVSGIAAMLSMEGYKFRYRSLQLIAFAFWYARYLLLLFLLGIWEKVEGALGCWRCGSSHWWIRWHSLNEFLLE